MDLIDRQKAIDRIEAIFPVDPHANECAEGVAIGAALAKQYIETLPSAQPEQRWIPCSERLPFAEYGESETVFTTCKHREPLLGDGGYLWVKLLYFNGSNWCHPTGEAFDDIVVAWMPLPEPYREVDHETD